MQERFDYGVPRKMRVTNETIKGLVIDFGVQKADNSIATLLDLNKIQLSVILNRANQAPKTIYSGQLDEYLTGLYAQQVEYALTKKAFGKTYKIYIDFMGVLKLNNGDVLEVELNAQEAAFDSLSKANSYINVHTLPAVGSPTPIICVKSKGVETGTVEIDESIGDNVYKLVAAFDFGATYEASVKAKFSGTVNVLADGYERALTKEALEAENIYRFDDNPESSVAQMVLFQEPEQLIHNVRVKGTVTPAVDASARLISAHYEII